MIQSLCFICFVIIFFLFHLLHSFLSSLFSHSYTQCCISPQIFGHEHSLLGPSFWYRIILILFNFFFVKPLRTNKNEKKRKNVQKCARHARRIPKTFNEQYGEEKWHFEINKTITDYRWQIHGLPCCVRDGGFGALKQKQQTFIFVLSHNNNKKNGKRKTQTHTLIISN